MSVLLTGVAALLLLAAPLEEARAQNAPRVTAVTFESFPKSGDTYKRGEEIRLGVTFSDAVVVTGTPRIRVWLVKRVYRWADYNAALSEGSRLTFVYTVQAGDLSPGGLLVGWGESYPLSLNGGTIKSADGLTDADLIYGYGEVASWFVGRRAAVKVDGNQVDDSASAAPTAHSISISSTPAEGNVYKLGEKLSVGMDFDGDVAVKGVPTIILDMHASTGGLSAQWANYDGALSTARRLVFSYTVQESDAARSFKARVYSLRLNGGAIRSQADERDANIHRATFSGNAGGAVNGLRGVSTPTVPVVTGVRIRTPKNGDTFELQETISGYIVFAPAVRAWVYHGGWYHGPPATPNSPHLALTIGTQTRRVPVYSSSNGRIVFSYTVQDGDRDMDGLSIAANALTTGSKATIVHAHPTLRWSQTRANLSLGSHAVSNDARYKVDGGGGTSPGGSNPEPGLRVSAVRFTGTPASGVTYRLGGQIQAAVTFTEAVTVTGTPQLGLTIGTQTRQAVYDATQSKGTFVVFTYYVQATDTDADGISIAANALTLNGGTITRASNSATAAALAHAGVGTDDTRKVDGSTDVVEHGNSRAAATLVPLTARTTGGVGETGQEDDFRVDVATDRSAEVAGALEQADDADYFRVEVTEAGSLTVETTGSTDTVGYLQGARGQHLSGDDNTGTENNFQVVRQVLAGTYYIRVEGAHEGRVTGLYRLAVRFTPAGGGTPSGGAAVSEHGNTRAEATRVGVNSETRGALEQAGDVDYFRVEVTAAGTLTVETRGSTDTAGYFGAEAGPWLSQNDNAGEGGNFRAVWQVRAGTYYVAVVGGSNRTATGTYTLVVGFTGADAEVEEHGNTRVAATPVAVNSETAGILERAGDVDYFRVTVTAAGTLTVGTVGPTDTVGYVGGTAGPWLSVNDDQANDLNFRIVRQVTSGTYYVAVVGGDERTQTGAYTLQVGFTADEAGDDHGNRVERATRVSVNTDTAGRLEGAGDVDYFRVEVTVGGTLTVETVGETDTYGYVRDGTGATLGHDEEAGAGENFRVVREVEAGTYVVAVVGGAARTATGPYTLRVSLATE